MIYRPRVVPLVDKPKLRVQQGNWCPPLSRNTSMLAPNTFRFLNFEYTLPSVGGWNESGLDKLWLYNLHYFDDLNSHEAFKRTEWHQRLIERWLLENPPACGNGWEPYPTSLRIVNWTKWLARGNAAVPGMLESLALQASWLTKRLEFHLLGNHLFVNAKALIFAGLLFDGPQAAAWLRTGLEIITRELPEQVLPDGGNFELSTMYHALFLEDVLDLLNISGAYVNQMPTKLLAQLRDTSLRMFDWLQGMTHPDGQIALFNDAAFEVAATTTELLIYAGRVLGISGELSGLSPRCASCDERSSVRLRRWAESGYIRLECTAAVALLDVAPIGPDYLPGHAHADTLSFELSLFDERVIVNGGTSRYGVGPERLRERQTVSHSTVEVDGQSSSEVWGGFRVAQRAYPFDLAVSEEAHAVSVACSHDGYKRFTGKPVHRRSWHFNPSHMVVVDSVSGVYQSAVARYILHPNVTVVQLAPDAFQLTLTNDRLILLKIGKGSARLEYSSFAPEFGKVLPTHCVAVDLQDGKAQVKFIWS